jgi:hypothetical protein
VRLVGEFCLRECKHEFVHLQLYRDIQSTHTHTHTHTLYIYIYIYIYNEEKLQHPGRHLVLTPVIPATLKAEIRKMEV